MDNKIVEELLENIPLPSFIVNKVNLNIVYKNTRFASIIKYETNFLSDLISKNELSSILFAKPKVVRDVTLTDTYDAKRARAKVIYNDDNLLALSLFYEEDDGYKLYLLKSVIDNFPGSVTVRDNEGKLILHNTTFSEMMKRNTSELKGSTVYDLYYSEIASNLDSYIKNVIETKTTQKVELGPDDNGNWKSYIFKPIKYDDNSEGILTIEYNNDFNNKDLTSQNKLVDYLKSYLTDYDTENINYVLRLIAEYTQSDRVYVCTINDDNGIYYADLMYDWPHLQIPQPPEHVFHQEWFSNLAGNSFVDTIIEDYYPLDSSLNDDNSISILLAPIFLGPSLWGFIGVEEYWIGKSWTEMEKNTVKAVGELVGRFINMAGLMNELRIYQERFENVTDATGALLWEVDSDFRFTYLSEKCETLTGYTKEELIGRPWDIIIPYSVKSLIEQGSDDIFIGVEQRLRRKDGDVRWIKSSGKFIRDIEGNLSKIHGNSLDITEAKDMDQNLRNAKFALENANKLLIDSAKVSQELADEASKASKAKSEFLANMSHEIRTPMNAILGMLHIVMQTDLQSNQREYLEKVDFAANSLLRIINDILDFSKIEAGKLTMEIVEFNLEEVLMHALNIMYIKAHEKSLEILVSIPPKMPKIILGDPLRLSQVIVNLVSNAIKFTHKGEITIIVDIEENDDENITLRFAVKDTGIGIHKDYIPKLFRAFTQADSSTTRNYGGTGLGLALCRNIVELMGGRIWAESEVGEGTTFYFTSNFGKNTNSIPANSWEESFRDLRILVADDNFTALSILEEMLQSMGCRHIDLVYNGEDAVTMVRKSLEDGLYYDILLIDRQMPGMDGVEVINAIKELDIPGKIVTLFMATSYNRQDLEEEVLSGAITSVLVKPIANSVLYDTILSALYRKRKETVVKPFAYQVKPDVSIRENQFRGMKVLIVEDNELNQLVASELLKSKGCEIKIASNGEEAIETIHKYNFDIVFMDIQMPVMDGITAIKKIRMEEKYKSLPVIAMTANALQGDREKSISAGMNGHITKPISQKELYACLEMVKSNNYTLALDNSGRVLRKPTIAKRSVPGVKSSSANKLLPDNIDGLNLVEGLDRVSGNEELYKIILLKIKDDIPELFTKFNDSLSNGYMGEARSYLHTMKGVLGNVAANDAYRSASRLENVIVKGDNFNAELKDFEIKIEGIVKSLSNLQI